MGSLWQDLRYGLRVLKKSPAFTLVAVLTLAVGLVANGVLFSLADAAVFRPLPIRDPRGLVLIFTSAKDASGQGLYGPSSYPEFADLKAQSKTFSDIAVYQRRGAILNSSGERTMLFAIWVSGNYFSLLGANAHLGRTFTEDEVARRDAPLVVVLGYSFWQRQFGGDPQIVGKPINLNGQLWTVLGVAPREFRGLDRIMNPDIWIPESLLPGIATEDNDRNLREHEMMARLQPGTSLQKAQAELSTIASQMAQAYPKTNAGRKLTADFEVHYRLTSGLATLSLLILAIPALVLLIACANVAGLLLARALDRRREIAVRLALGAGRFPLIRQFLVEALLLALGGAAGALLLSKWMIDLLPRLVPATTFSLGLDPRLDTRMLVFTLLAMLVSVFLSALVPALRASRADLNTDLKDQAAPAGYATRRMALRKLLVSGQVAVSLVLLVGAALLTRSLRNELAANPGFNPHQNLLLVNPSLWDYDENHRRQLFPQMTERVESIPGVLQAGLATFVPFSPSGGGAAQTLWTPGMQLPPGQDGVAIHCDSVDPNYFRVLGVPILRGRAFTKADSAAAPGVAIMNETLARRFWPAQDPLGQHFRVGGSKGRDCEVVGIAQDGKYNNLTEPPVPYLYLPLYQNAAGDLTLIVKTARDPHALASAVRSELKSVDANISVLGTLTIDDHMRSAFFGERMTAQLVGVLGAIGLLLVSVGLYGVASYSMSRRTREIGVRLALGAERADIFRMVLREGLYLALTGVVVGLLAAFALTRLLSSALYGVKAADPFSFLFAAVLLLLVTLLACYFPARRATRVDPIIALRSE